ncbi:MAG TPA: hypothetical protein VF984_01535 [Actinomycetota bacterium]
MRPFRIVSFVVGIFLALVGLGLLAGGGLLVWAHTTQRDAQGYYTTGTHDYATGTYALTSPNVDLGTSPDRWVPYNLGTVRIAATGTEGKPVFVGIGPESAVDRYLSGVDHSVVTDVGLSPFGVTTTEVSGTRTPGPPSEQGFWEASAAGPATTLTWDVRSGSWAVVVMNADGSKGVDVQMSIGAKTGLLLPIGIGVLIVGILFAAGAVVLIVVGKPSAWQRAPVSAATPPAPPGSIPPPAAPATPTSGPPPASPAGPSPPPPPEPPSDPSTG